MAVVGPAAGLVGGDEITEFLARLDVNRMLVRTVFAVAVFELAPEAVQMDRVLHHRVIDQHEAHAFAALQDNRPGFGEFLAVEAPDEALHVAGEMEIDVARGRAEISARPRGADRRRSAPAARRENLRRRGPG